MKRILLACCLLAATCSFSYAQSTVAPQTPTVSKTEFTTQVGQLNTLLTSNKIDDAQHKWDDVHKIMMNGLAVTKNKIRIAHEANNQEEIKKYSDVMVKQRNLYSEILQLARGDMGANKAQLKEKLQDFGTTIL
jgi:hypothetical protein